MNRSELIKQSRLFEEESAQDDVYPMALAWVRSHQSWPDKIPGIAALLAVWNGNDYWEAVKSLRHVLDRADIQADLDSLREERLDTCNLEEHTPTLATLWESFLLEPGFGSTAVSKTLHMLIPNLFLPWDNDIADIHHRSWHFREHEKRSGQCYSDFLRAMQVECIKCLSGTSEEVMTSQLAEISGYSKPMTKAIDEANFNRVHR